MLNHTKLLVLRSITARRLSTTARRHKEFENPLSRTFRVLKGDFERLQPPSEHEEEKRRALAGVFPNHADVVIVGGGAIGSSIAYWLKEKSARDGIRVVVLEKDPSYAECSTALSVGGLRQQFSLPENIQMSCYGAHFLRTLKRRFGAAADVRFTPHGYLVLAREHAAQQLIDNAKIQKELGAVNVILTPEQIRARFPWMRVDDVAVGCLGLEKEGWFDPWALLTLLKAGAAEMGAQYVHGEAVDFNFQARQDFFVDGVEHGHYESVNEIVVKLPNGEHKSIEFAYCVLAAGAESATIAQNAKIGAGGGMLSVPLPVERRKRYVFCYECQGDKASMPGINAPMVMDTSGAYFRREGLGGCFIGGVSPLPHEEPPTDNLDVDFEYFDTKLWPLLVNRVEAFNAVKVKSAWAGFYEYNYIDQNGIVGPHPYYHNFYIATGFSGHGIQQAPAVGRAVAELIIDGDFKTIDLTRLGFDRFIVDKPMYEVGVY